MRNAIASVVALLACSPTPREDSLGALNSPAVEYGATEAPFGVFVTRQNEPWGRSGASRIELVRGNGSVERVDIGGAHNDSDPFFSESRQQLCFVSDRPREGGSQDSDIWCADWLESGWGPPQRLPAPVNSEAAEFSPVFSSDGTLFFASDRAGGLGQGDLYAAREEDGAWRVTPLGDAVNSAYGEWNLGVSPDGATIILESSGRPTNRTTPGDLYLTHRGGGAWSAPVPLSRLNSDASDLMPRWMRDGRLLYASARVGGGDVDHFAALPGSYEPIEPALSVVSRSTGEVVILDPQTLAERARYSVGGGGPHEIAATDDGRFAVMPLLGQYPEPHAAPVSSRPRFINERSRGLAVLDLATGEHEIQALRACARPHGVAMHAQARRLWITCESEGSVIELDPEGWRVTRSFAVGRGVHKLVLAPSGEFLVATNPDQGGVSIIMLENADVHTLQTGGGTEGLTLDALSAKAWVANGNDATFCRIDLARRAIEWCRPTGGSFPIAVALAGDEIWISRLGSSDIGVFSAEDGVLIEEIGLASGALNLAVNARDGKVYATLPRLNEVIAIDAETRRIVARAEGVMEGDDLDLIPPQAFRAPPDP